VTKAQKNRIVAVERYALLADGHVVALARGESLPKDATHWCLPGAREWTKA
jgi:hypothetical protein